MLGTWGRVRHRLGFGTSDLRGEGAGSWGGGQAKGGSHLVPGGGRQQGLVSGKWGGGGTSGGEWGPQWSPCFQGNKCEPQLSFVRICLQLTAGSKRQEIRPGCWCPRPWLPSARGQAVLGQVAPGGLWDVLAGRKREWDPRVRRPAGLGTPWSPPRSAGPRHDPSCSQPRGALSAQLPGLQPWTVLLSLPGGKRQAQGRCPSGNHAPQAHSFQLAQCPT